MRDKSKRAQATLEFMFMFLAVILFTTLLIGGMALAKNRAMEQVGAIEHTVMMEELARTIETHSNIGLAMIFDIDERGYEVEYDKVKYEYGNRTLVVEVNVRNATHYEPV